MKQRKIQTFFILSFLALSFLHTEAQNKENYKRPNIIFILTDDQRWSALGYEGNKQVHTPEMDKLAKEGTYFKNAFSSTPICSASRASIFSGLFERTHRYTFQTGPIKDVFMEHAYPLELRKDGYYTGFFGKFGVTYNYLDKLYDVYDSYDRKGAKDSTSYFYKTIGKDTVHLTRYTGQEALNFIAKVPRDKPFCLQLSFSAPHAADGAPAQYFWQQSTDYLFQNETMPPPILAEDKYFNELPEAVKKGFNRVRWTWRYDTPEKYQHSVKGYYRMIAGIDLEIGKIRAELKAKGLAKNTIIILMGDNGYFMGERQLAGKWLMYENSIRVPLIIMDPRKPRHQDIDKMALNLDVPYTILDFAGVKIPKSYQGESLKPIVEGTSKLPDRDAILIEHLWEFPHIPASEGVRTNNWKYFRYVDNKSIEDLYNLKSDPMETKNLSSDPKYKNKLIALRKKLEELSQKYDSKYNKGPAGLRVDFNPSSKGGALIKVNPPVFSWIVPKLAKSQQAYQILVSSSKKELDLNEADLWDSKKVKSNESDNILYNGHVLKTSGTYYWKVRIWDADNRTSDYSKPQSFQITSD